MSECSNILILHGSENPELIIGGDVIIKDHSKLENLDFEKSGHTGFQKELTSEQLNQIENAVGQDVFNVFKSEQKAKDDLQDIEIANKVEHTVFTDFKTTQEQNNSEQSQAIMDVTSKLSSLILNIEIDKDGFGNYTADYNDNDINNFRNAGGVVQAKYYDSDKNQTYTYYYSTMESDRKPTFIRTYIEDELTKQVLISVDNAKKVTVVTRTAGITQAQLDSKADQDYVDAELNSKANKGEFEIFKTAQEQNNAEQEQDIIERQKFFNSFYAISVTEPKTPVTLDSAIENAVHLRFNGTSATIDFITSLTEETQYTFYVYCTTVFGLGFGSPVFTINGKPPRWLETPTLNDNNDTLLAFQTNDGGRTWVGNKCYEITPTSEV